MSAASGLSRAAPPGGCKSVHPDPRKQTLGAAINRHQQAAKCLHSTSRYVQMSALGAYISCIPHGTMSAMCEAPSIAACGAALEITTSAGGGRCCCSHAAASMPGQQGAPRQVLTAATAPTTWEPTWLLLLLSRCSVCSGSSPRGVAPHSRTELFR